MKTKWGVIGSAGIARRRTIPEGIVAANNAELVAVYDIDQDANATVAAQFNTIACKSEAELFGMDLDVVYIATPTWLHCDQVLRAATAGKHVLCEKPLGMSVTECSRMVEDCEQYHVKLGTGFMMRYHAQHQAALQLLRTGGIGIPVFARAQLSCWYPPIPDAWRQSPQQGGGGSLMDLGGHCIDLLEMFMGPITALQCSIGNLVQSYASEDTAIAMLEFESGAKGVVDCLFNVPDNSSLNRLELYGSKGSILAEGTIGQGEKGIMTARLDQNSSGYAAQQERTTDGGLIISPTPVNMYRAEVEAFAQAILDDKAPPVTGKDGLHSQTILTACYESANKGVQIKIGSVGSL